MHYSHHAHPFIHMLRNLVKVGNVASSWKKKSQLHVIYIINHLLFGMTLLRWEAVETHQVPVSTGLLTVNILLIYLQNIIVIFIILLVSMKKKCSGCMVMFMNVSNVPRISIALTLISAVKHSIRKFKTGKHESFDWSSTDFTLSCTELLCHHLSTLFTLMLFHCYAPVNFRMSTMIPIPKGSGSMSDIKSY